ncbi:TniQ family protein [Bacillus circulans]|uniref:TnsD family Tn7-like transposition protein n=1 Tax=Niallia circulans TaxID=1397 RepID=UPI00155FADE3|nr:TnsD family Tn7-like transposition protein [Niallia circulans]NRG28811.1 TniQ family protein [Niallia circulans]
MMNFWPLMYEDELFVSVIARYQRICGMVSKRALEMDLFQIYKRMGRKSVLFPQNLNTFVANLPPTSRLSAKEIILNHTMYPFYTAFMSVEKSDVVFNGMASGSGKCIENLVGMAGSKVKSNSYLRYCPLCFAQDLEEYGESYWRRLPQVPGTLYCPKHHVLYKDSNVVITDCRNNYLCADEDTGNTELVEDVYPNDFKELNLKYTENVLYLFHNQTRKDLSFIIKFYIDRLRERELASKSGSLYMEKLLETFLAFYPEDYLEIMQSRVDMEQEANWLRLFVRNNNKNRSPLRHLLFLQLLNVGVEELFESDKVIGKRTVINNRIPSYSIEERRKEWLNLIEANPKTNRSQLKKIAKGLHTWIYMNDWDWYDKVTPRYETRKKRAEAVDWQKRDEECLALAKEAVKGLYRKEGKPIRILPSNIRKEIGAKRWFDNKKLVKTRQFIKEVTEKIEDYRVRKIIWVINEMLKNGERLTVYKIQLKAGFGGANKEIKIEIERILKKGT